MVTTVPIARSALARTGETDAVVGDFEFQSPIHLPGTNGNPACPGMTHHIGQGFVDDGQDVVAAGGRNGREVVELEIELDGDQ